MLDDTTPTTPVHQMAGDQLADRYLNEVAPETDEPEEETPAETPDADDGANDGADESASEAGTDDAAEGTPDTDAAPASEDTEEAKAAEATDRAPVIKFRLLDHKGDEVLPAQGLTIELDVKGESRRYPIDVAARLARQGIAASRLHQDYSELYAQHQGLTAKLPELKTLWDNEVAYRERLLTDDEFYDTERQKFASKNTPEARLAAREAADARAAREEQEAAEVSTAAERFEADLKPVFIDLVSRYADVVPPDRVLERIAAATVHLRHGPRGIIPAAAMPEVRRLIEGPIADWLESEAVRVDAERRSTAAATDKKVAAAVKSERERTTRQKQDGIRHLKPTARRTTGAPVPQAQRPPRTAAESVERSLDRHLNAAFSKG